MREREAAPGCRQGVETWGRERERDLVSSFHFTLRAGTVHPMQFNDSEVSVDFLYGDENSAFRRGCLNRMMMLSRGP